MPLIIVLCVGIAIGAYTGASIPSWYADSVAATATEPGPADRDSPPGGDTPDGDRRAGNTPAGGRTVGERSAEDASIDPDSLLRRLRSDGQVSIDSQMLTELATTALASSRDGREFLRVSDGIAATIDPEAVEIGAVFDLSALNEEELSRDTREGLAKLRGAAPFLLNAKRYLGVRGLPRATRGRLGFEPGATLRVGVLGLPVDALAWLGSDEIGNASVALPDLEVTRVSVEADRLTVEARPTSR